MTASSEKYTELLNIYRKKSRDDLEIVKKYIDEKTKKIGKKLIDELIIKEFCKYIHYVRAFTYKSFEDELNPKKINLELIKSELDNPDSNILFYFLLRAADIFYEKNNFYPGSDLKKEMKDDIKELKVILLQLFKDHNIENIPSDVDNYVAEMVRFGCGEIHNISSLVGGVGAQELIKLCTQQRLPFCNTWIYNGFKGISQVYNL